MMRYLVGVDDTDNLESRGTGWLVRQLAEYLRIDHSAEPLRITRHQLLVHKHIPYTSHNSSACLLVDTEAADAVWETSRDFLALQAAKGSDVGLCLSAWDSVHRDVISLGQRAKVEVLTLEEAVKTASKSHIRQEGITGDGGGVIGALAAIGLHRQGNDGRFLWLPGLRELQGIFPASEICDRAQIDRVCSLDNVEIPAEAMVDVGDWMRPVLRDGQATLYVEEKKHGWYVVSKERIKSLSN